MKGFSTALRAHLARAVTTITFCWRVVRRSDGVEFRFTAFDEDLTVDGDLYSSVAGFERSAIKSGSDGTVDNLDIVGYCTAGGIERDDVLAGRYDYSELYLLVVNWADPTQFGALRRGTLGECIVLPSGAFAAELRGMMQPLAQESGEFWQPLCRHDLGDPGCGVPVLPVDWTANTAIAEGTYVRPAIRGTDALKVAIFQADGGTTGASEPSWDTTIGNTTADNDITWTSQPYFRTIGTVSSVTDRATIEVSALSAPAVTDVATNHAVISIRDNVSAGTTVSLSDGVHSTGWSTTIDVRGSGDPGNEDAAHYIYNAIAASALSWTVTMSGGTLQIDNTSGSTGNISKTGDSLGAIVISNFSAPTWNRGTLTWIDGDNVDISIEVKSYDPDTGELVLWQAMPFDIAPGDKFYVYPGCDLRRDTCHLVFDNILNFDGEPDMPNMDALLSYPDVSG